MQLLNGKYTNRYITEREFEGRKKKENIVEAEKGIKRDIMMEMFLEAGKRRLSNRQSAPFPANLVNAVLRNKTLFK